MIDGNAVNLGATVAGHMGVAIEKDGQWYHFYFGAQNAIPSLFGAGGTRAELKKINFGNLPKNHDGINKLGVYEGTYTDSRYIKGDFSKSYDYIVNEIIGKANYSALTYNCKDTSIDILLQGNFGEYDVQYKEELARVKRRNRPNLAFGAFTTFHDNEAIRKRRKLEGIHV